MLKTRKNLKKRSRHIGGNIYDKKYVYDKNRYSPADGHIMRDYYFFYDLDKTFRRGKIEGIRYEDKGKTKIYNFKPVGDQAVEVKNIYDDKQIQNNFEPVGYKMEVTKNSNEKNNRRSTRRSTSKDNPKKPSGKTVSKVSPSSPS